MEIAPAARPLLSLASMRRSTVLVAPCLLLLAPAVAAAQAVAPGAVPVSAVPATPIAPAGPGLVPVLPAEPAAPPLVGLARRSAEDAASDRAYAAPTAIIAPRGTATVTVRAPVGPFIEAHLGYAMSDRLEVGLGTVFVPDEDTNVFSLHGKVQLLRGARSALAASLDVYQARGEDGYLATPSLVASLCADGDACRTLVNLHLTAAFVSDEDQLPVLPGVSIAMGGRTQLVGEAHLYNDEDSGESALFGYLGGRWTKGTLALDAGIGWFADTSPEPVYDAQPGCIDYCADDTVDASGPDVMPWPFVGLSARL